MTTQILAACKRCRKRHRSWYTRATCMLTPTYWVSGNPPIGGPCFASISDCRDGKVGGRTVQLYPTLEGAEKAKRLIDRMGCGGNCWRRHRVVELTARGPR